MSSVIRTQDHAFRATPPWTAGGEAPAWSDGVDAGERGAMPSGDFRPDLRSRLAHRLAMHLNVDRFRMSGGPLVTFTFDDAPDSALTAGAAELERFGCKGTYYIAGGLLGTRSDDWRVMDEDGVAELHARGHEIACHTHGHSFPRTFDGEALTGDVTRNRACLQDIVPALRLRNFAYPFGYGSLVGKRRLSKVFRSSRGAVPGINSGMMDLQFLRAVPLIDGQMNRDTIERLFERTVARKGWLIFYTHDVGPTPSAYGCTPALLAHALGAAERFAVTVATTDAALTRIGVPAAK